MKIRPITQPEEWPFIQGKLNPVDLATRSSLDEQPIPPSFLLQSEDHWTPDLPWMAVKEEIRPSRSYTAVVELLQLCSRFLAFIPYLYPSWCLFLYIFWTRCFVFDIRCVRLFFPFLFELRIFLNKLTALRQSCSHCQILNLLGFIFPVACQLEPHIHFSHRSFISHSFNHWIQDPFIHTRLLTTTRLREISTDSIRKNIWSFEPEVSNLRDLFLDIQLFKNPASRALSYWPLSQVWFRLTSLHLHCTVRLVIVSPRRIFTSSASIEIVIHHGR